MSSEQKQDQPRSEELLHTLLALYSEVDALLEAREGASKQPEVPVARRGERAAKA